MPSSRYRATAPTASTSRSAPRPDVRTAPTRAAPNGVEPQTPLTEEERAEARALLAIPSGAIVCAWVGGLDEHKDPLTPIRAVREFARQEIVLLMAGDGLMRDEVERAAGDSDA